MKLKYVKDLPPTRSRANADPVHRQIAAELRMKAVSKTDGWDDWALWPTPITTGTARSYASMIPRGKLAAFPAGEFEAKCPDGILHLRVRVEQKAEAA